MFLAEDFPMAPQEKWVNVVRKGMGRAWYIVGHRSGTYVEISDDIWFDISHSLHLPNFLSQDERDLIDKSSPKSFRQVTAR